jgi:hypothetical protein
MKRYAVLMAVTVLAGGLLGGQALGLERASEKDLAVIGGSAVACIQIANCTTPTKHSCTCSSACAMEFTHAADYDGHRCYGLDYWTDSTNGESLVCKRMRMYTASGGSHCGVYQKDLYANPVDGCAGTKATGANLY